MFTPGLEPTHTALPPTEPEPSQTPLPTATLRPTITSVPTATPVSRVLATPLSQPTGGGGSYAYGSTGSSSNRSGGIAPIGERGSEITSESTIIVSTPASPLTPTVPPSANERYTYTVAANQTLVVQYEMTVTRGTVILWAVAPSGEVVWQQSFTESVTDEAEITAAEGGEYDIFAYVERFSGSYQVGYTMR